MAEYSHCDGCGSVTFTTSYGSCHLCGAQKDKNMDTRYFDPRLSHARRVEAIAAAQRRFMLIVAGALLVAVVVAVFAVIFYIKWRT
jgi:ribosomal protein L37E